MSWAGVQGRGERGGEFERVDCEADLEKQKVEEEEVGEESEEEQEEEEEEEKKEEKEKKNREVGDPALAERSL